ncbi:DUF6387 family protein [Enterobacter roggenkampii]|uniref:DUF6387 family protein n=1 Tax=Enterobacter roggenkampii TaxID=1812935 RepID=UPI003890F848
MATRVQVKEITSWMSVEKYDVFESLTVEEVLSEIEFRTIFACEYDPKEGANKRGNSSRLTQSFHFFMFEPIFSPVNALNQPI